MRRSNLILFSVITVAISLIAVSQMNPTEALANQITSPVLRHVVMFKFKDESSQEEIETVVESFAALSNKIPEIQSLEYGENNSPEELNDGFTHCFLITFANEEGRAAYLPHPAHLEFVEILKPHLDKVLVVDYTQQR